MGWNPGEGLGKNKEGSTIPLMLEVKTDKKGNYFNPPIAPSILSTQLCDGYTMLDADSKIDGTR